MAHNTTSITNNGAQTKDAFAFLCEKGLSDSLFTPELIPAWQSRSAFAIGPKSKPLKELCPKPSEKAVKNAFKKAVNFKEADRLNWIYSKCMKIVHENSA